MLYTSRVLQRPMRAAADIALVIYMHGKKFTIFNLYNKYRLHGTMEGRGLLGGHHMGSTLNVC